MSLYRISPSFLFSRVAAGAEPLGPCTASFAFSLAAISHGNSVGSNSEPKPVSSSSSQFYDFALRWVLVVGLVPSDLERHSLSNFRLPSSILGGFGFCSVDDDISARLLFSARPLFLSTDLFFKIKICLDYFMTFFFNNL